MTILRRFPALAFSLVLVAIAGFSVATESFGLLVIGGALAALSWYITEGPRGRTLPRWVSNILLLAVLLNTAVDWIQHGMGGEVIGVIGRFTLWLSIIKLYERKGVRDYAQLLALSAVLMVSGCLHTVQFSFGVLLLLYLFLGLPTLLLFQLHVGFERAREERRRTAPPGARLVPPVQPVTSPGTAAHFRRLAAVSGVLGLALSAVFFIAFPRNISAQSFGMQALAGRQAGFSEEVRLSEPGRISESRREVLTVAMLDPQGVPIQYSEPLRLRGAVLDQYAPRDGRWVASRSGRESMRPITLLEDDVFMSLAPNLVDDRVDTYTQVVNMRSTTTDTLFASYAPIAVAADAGRTIAFDPMTLVLRDQRGNRTGHVSQYRVRVKPFAGEATLARLSGEQAPPAVQATLPMEDVRIEALRILGERNIDPFQVFEDEEESWRHRVRIARALTQELQSDAYVYTTDLSTFVRRINEDPIVLFLTRYRTGHCELFASALAAMCRSVGVEARLITGYLAAEYDSTARHYIVRENNAHAWVEVRSGPYTWSTFDPTPPAALRDLAEPRQSWADGWRWLYDRLEFTWNSRFVSFDGRTQATLLERFNDRWSGEGLREWMRSTMERVNAFVRLGPVGYLWVALISVAAISAGIAVFALIRRWAAIMRVTGLGHLPWRRARWLAGELGFYLDLLKVLERAGLRKPEWQTPAAFAEMVAEARPEVGDDVRRLIERFYETRYGGRSLGMLRRRALVGEVARVAQRLGVRPPR